MLSGSIIDDISDHFITFLSPKLGKVKSKPQHVARRIHSSANIANFKTALSNSSWDEVLATNDVESCYTGFWNTYNTLYNHHFPLTKSKFNKNIHKISSTIANSVEPTTKTFSDYLPPAEPNSPTLSFTPITLTQLISTINSMASKNSTDICGISTKMIKAVKFEIATPLLPLFNLSLTTGTFPSQLKTSRTIPVFKAGERTNCDNYRPISLLSSISKILEKS